MQFKRRLSPESKVDLIPMIDVVFQLVIFFMVTSTFMMTPGIHLILPSSTTAEPVVMTEMVITISSQEEIYINKDKYTLQEFSDALGNLSESDREDIESVVIEGDQGVAYSLMIKVLDQLRLNGFSQFSLKLREELIE